jgi:dTDP-4-amino-4,6-dideoxygalactose transaminase
VNIPFMRLDRQYAEHKEEFLAAILPVLEHGRVLQAQEVSELEARMAAFFGLPHGVAVGSGTDALILALKALGLKPGGRVAVTDLSFVASASAIVLAGGVPVFVDVDPKYGLAREDVLLDLVQRKAVDGVIAVHLYGQMAELAEIHAEARRQDVFVIEDAAQALGATRNGVAPGRFSDLTCVSFDPTKVIGAHGSGGLILAHDPAHAERLRRLRYHGHAGKRVYSEIGHNTQLPTVQAALISMKMNHEEAWRLRRQAIAAEYSRACADSGLLAAPQVRPGNTHIFHKYVLSAGVHRDALAAHLKERGVATSVHYSLPLHEQPCFAGHHETAGGRDGDLPATRKLVAEILSLPIYPELTDAEVAHIGDALRAFKP